MSEWINECFFKPNKQFFTYIMARICYIRWGDNDVHIVLDQHVYLDFIVLTEQQYMDNHVAPLEHIILIPSQPLVALSP